MLPLRAIAGRLRVVLVGLMLMGVVGCELPQDIQRQQGMDAYREHDLARAKSKFSRIVERDPTDWKAHYYLGLIALDEDQPQVAQSRLAVAYTLHGKGPPRHSETPRIADAMAEALYRQGNYVRLIGFCDEVIGTFGAVGDYLRKARYLVKIGDHDSAETAYRTAVRIQPRNLDLYLELADFYQSVGRTDRELVELRKAYGLANSEVVRQRLGERLRAYGLEPGPDVVLPPDGP